MDAKHDEQPQPACHCCEEHCHACPDEPDEPARSARRRGLGSIIIVAVVGALCIASRFVITEPAEATVEQATQVAVARNLLTFLGVIFIIAALLKNARR
jgi:uncharacterized membrane protein